MNRTLKEVGGGVAHQVDQLGRVTRPSPNHEAELAEVTPQRMISCVLWRTRTSRLRETRASAGRSINPPRVSSP